MIHLVSVDRCLRCTTPSGLRRPRSRHHRAPGAGLCMFGTEREFLLHRTSYIRTKLPSRNNYHLLMEESTHFRCVTVIYLSLASFARFVRQVRDRVFSLPFMAQTPSSRAMKTRKEKRGSITCGSDRANDTNKMFIKWLC